MKGENNILLFGEFLGITDQADSSKGFELHWETEDKTLIRDISASSNTIVIVLNDGTSFSLGYNASGQLGIGSCAFCSNFTKVSSNTPFDSVSCGTNFTVWRSSTTNELFISGSGFSDHPQRFLISNNKGSALKTFSMDSYEDTFAAIEEGGMVYLWPHLINSSPINSTESESNTPKNNSFFTCLLPSKPSELSCGNGFATVLCDGYVFRVQSDGSFSPIFSISHHLIHSLPLSTNTNTTSLTASTPHSNSITDSHTSNTILAASAKSAADYTIVLDTEGAVWLHGTIGGLNRRINTAPIAQGMRSIFAMPSFCAFVNNIGITYAVGLNESGQLADGTKTKRTRAVETKVDKPVISIVGGSTFSVFACSQFDSSLFEVNMDEFVPGHMNCPFEKAEDMIDATTTP